MENWYGAQLCKEARKLSRGEEKIKISAIHAGISAGAALVVTVLYYVLEKGIAQTGGLSGMGLRSILQTAATVLSTANSVLTPFWNLGFWFVALLWVREQPVQFGDLLTGFRRFGAYLRLTLSRVLLIIAAGCLSMYASSYLYMLTPWSGAVLAFAQSAGMDMEAANQLLNQMEIGQIDVLLRSMAPMLVIWMALFAVLAMPMLYRFRMAEYFLLEDRRMGALRAMLASAQMLRKRRARLFLLDLRFWWYYGLHILCLAVYGIDLWLPMLGVAVPDSVFVTLGLYGFYLIALVLMQTFLRPQVQTAYALAYDRLLHMEPVLPKMRPAPQNLPWDET